MPRTGRLHVADKQPYEELSMFILLLSKICRDHLVGEEKKKTQKKHRRYSSYF